MENFILTVKRKQTAEERANLEEISIKMDYDTQEDCLAAVKGTKNFWFMNDEVEAFMTINRHDSVNGNESCSYYSIDIDTLELTLIR